MAARISLALAIHNHQPVGNFGWVFAEVYDAAYLPMVEALERHPDVRLSLHYTGPLLEWLAAERPDFLARLGALVASDQVELLGGGLYEPVLASLPEHDRVDQLTRMASVIAGITGQPAAGRVAGRTRVGARPADGAREGRLPLDDPRRPALPGRRHPRGEPLGRVHDRGPGPRADRVRDRAGPALPDPVRDRRVRHRLPPRPRDRGRQAGRDDGRRRREVRRLAHDLRPLLGRGPLGRAVLRGPGGEPRLADDGDAVAVAGARAADRAGVRADQLLRRDGRVGAAARRDRRCSRGCSTTRSPGTTRRRAGCAAGSGATSR